jgi:hypothetical protein
MGLTWVNRVGVVTLVLGAAFFFKYAVESGWIGPLARVLIGAAAGLGALGIAERAWRGHTGICNEEKGYTYQLHSNKFNFDEKAFRILSLHQGGYDLFSGLVLKLDRR